MTKKNILFLIFTLTITAMFVVTIVLLACREQPEQGLFVETMILNTDEHINNRFLVKATTDLQDFKDAFVEENKNLSDLEISTAMLKEMGYPQKIIDSMSQEEILQNLIVEKSELYEFKNVLHKVGIDYDMSIYVSYRYFRKTEGLPMSLILLAGYFDCQKFGNSKIDGDILGFYVASQLSNLNYPDNGNFPFLKQFKFCKVSYEKNSEPKLLYTQNGYGNYVGNQINLWAASRQLSRMTFSLPQKSQTIMGTLQTVRQVEGITREEIRVFYGHSLKRSQIELIENGYFTM